MLLLCYLLSAEGSKDATLTLVTPIPENNSWIQIQDKMFAISLPLRIAF